MATEANVNRGPEPRRSRGSSPSGEVPPGCVQKYWTPNLGCNIRIDLATGIPEYSDYLNSTSWVIRSGLRHCGGDNTVSYFGDQVRRYPKAIWPQMIKLRPESVPLHPGHETVSAYFPFGETAVTDLIEGQLAFLHHVRTYEDAHPGTRLLQRNLCWKIDEIAAGINEVVQLGGQPNGWAVRNSKTLSRALRHTASLKLGKILEASIEQLNSATSLRPFNWELRKFFAFLMANSKGRFQTWIAPVACSCKRFLDWDFTIGISAIQGHSRMPEQVADIAQGEIEAYSCTGQGAGIYIPRRGESQLREHQERWSPVASHAKGVATPSRCNPPHLRGRLRKPWPGHGDSLWGEYLLCTARHRHLL